jgi:uncharacterized protein (TIGR03437 family)
MLRTSALLFFCLASLGRSQTNQITVASAADRSPDLAAGSLAAIAGSNLSSQSAQAPSAPWPTSLAGITVQVTDSGSLTRTAGLLFVSPSQVNFQVPPGTALGTATVMLQNGAVTLTAHVLIRPVAPALFNINDLDIAAATAVRIALPTGIQSPVLVFRCVDTAGSCRLVPIDPGIDAPVYLSFYGTGISGTDIQVAIGGVTAAPTYVGPQGQFPGLDQVNVGLPLSLHGAGDVTVTVTAGGVTSNAVKIAVQ